MKIKNKKGFTLVELLVVLSILALLISLVGPTVYKHIAPAKKSIAKAQIENFASALDAFYIDVGRYPLSTEGLEALVNKPSGVVKWNGPYLKKNIPKDPWGNEYIYRCPGRENPYEIISLGADGKEGGEGENQDITNNEN